MFPVFRIGSPRRTRPKSEDSKARPPVSFRQTTQIKIGREKTVCASLLNRLRCIRSDKRVKQFFDSRFCCFKTQNSATVPRRVHGASTRETYRLLKIVTQPAT